MVKMFKNKTEFVFKLRTICVEWLIAVRGVLGRFTHKFLPRIRDGFQEWAR